jgi:hypothetical protein
MVERGARIARRLNDLAFAAVAGVGLILVLLRMNLSTEILWWSGLALAALAPLLALTSVVIGLAAGIGWPMRSAIALILGIVVFVWPLLYWLLFSNCPGYC